MAKERIAILGGGIGALAAAFELTSNENWDERFEITVYQVGWRLGGKCASGRNHEIKDRIEEHGIHFLLGFYENAFRMVRTSYDEYLHHGFPSPYDTWKDAFRNQRTVTAMVPVGEDWEPFSVSWPMLPGDPGDAAMNPSGGPPSPWNYVSMILGWLKSSLQPFTTTVEAQFAEPIPILVPVVEFSLKPLLDLINRTFDSIDGMVKPPAQGDRLLSRLVAATDAMGLIISGVLSAPLLPLELKQALIMFDIGIAVIRGMIKDRVIFEGFRAVDDHDFIDWLRRHGAKHPDSAVVVAGYDACFAFVEGDPARPKMSTAVGLHGLLRLWFTYKGSIFWPMRAGMGDVMFSPLFRALSKRGVRFEFFHRVSHLGLSADKRRVERIEIDVQATLKDPSTPYMALVEVKGMECWPNHPRYEQLNEEEVLKGHDLESAWAAPAPVDQKTLQLGRDFDKVVLGISLGALKNICSELVTASPRWHDMVAHIPTVQTQAVQLWLKRPADDLGYDAGINTPDPPCVSGFVEPFDTYVDMTETAEREGWVAADKVRNVSYFCNALPLAAYIPEPGTDPSFPATENARVRQNVVLFLTRHVKSLWPIAAMGPGGFDWGQLVDLQSGTGSQRLDSQYYRANIDPSARYVLSLPGTMKYRLLPDDSQFANLFLAGDWTFTAMNSGCVEAATMSGFKAAQGISGIFRPIYGWT